MTTNTLRKDKAWLHEQTLKIHIEEIEKLTSPEGMLNVNDRIQYCQSTNDKIASNAVLSVIGHLI